MGVFHTDASLQPLHTFPVKVDNVSRVLKSDLKGKLICIQDELYTKRAQLHREAPVSY